MRTPIAAALALVLAFGCTDQATSPTALNEAAVAPTFNFSNNPDAGPNIVRFEDGLGYIINDTKKGIQALFGFDPVLICTSGGPFDLVDVQDITIPNEIDRINSVVHGDDIFTTVWDFTGFDCPSYLENEPLATGLSRIRNTDNDLNSFLYDHNNANAFGLNAHGKLDNGMLNAHERISWQPSEGRFNETSVVNFH